MHMLSQFRHRYPQGSLTSELLQIDRGQYIVRVLVQVGDRLLGTGLGAAETVERAEDRARVRALALLDLDASSGDSQPVPQPEAGPISPQLPLAKGAEGDRRRSSPAELLDSPKDREGAGEGKPQGEPGVPWPQEPPAPKTLPQLEPLGLESPPEILEPEGEEPPTPESPVAVPLSEPIDFSEIIARTNIELKRLGWTSEQGRNYLLQTYGKRSRQLLTDEELLEFLHYLETLSTSSPPTP